MRAQSQLRVASCSVATAKRRGGPRARTRSRATGSCTCSARPRPAKTSQAPDPGVGAILGRGCQKPPDISGIIAPGADQDGETPRRMQPSACVIGEKGLNEKPGRAPTGQRSPSASAAGYGAGEGESRTGAPALEARASGWLQASAGAARRATVPEAGPLSRGPRRGPHSRPAR